MQIEGTREAFIALINERGIYKRLGVERSTVSNWKAYMKEGKSISLDKMEEMLTKAGATVVKEKVWEVGIEVEYEKLLKLDHELSEKIIGDSITINYLNWPTRVGAFNRISDHALKLNSGLQQMTNDEIIWTYTFTEKKI